MIVTEKDAAEKACVNDQATFDGRIGTPCMGSRCMAWRWAEAPVQRAAVRHTMFQAATPEHRPRNVPEEWEFVPHDRETGDSAMWVEPEGRDRTGFCGLAGQPAFPR